MSKITVEAKVYGTLQVQVADAESGVMRADSGKFKNALLNLLFAEGGDNLANCWCATDSVVNVTDTSVTGPLGKTSSVVKSSSITMEGSNVVLTQKRVYTFTPGGIVGNISSIGLNLQATNTSMYVKSLIKDVDGVPTTITATATDQVTVTHDLITTWEQHQSLGNIVIDGVSYSADLYNTIAMATLTFDPVTQRADYGGSSYFFGVHETFTPPTLPVAANGSSYVTGLSAQLHPSIQLQPVKNSPNVVGTLSQTFTYSVSAAQNIGTNKPIEAISVKNNLGSSYNFAIKFTPPLPKNNTIAYEFKLKFSLSRA